MHKRFFTNSFCFYIGNCGNRWGAEVPKAMAEAFRSGNLGIMDYYRMKNIQADTSMRENIADVYKRQSKQLLQNLLYGFFSPHSYVVPPMQYSKLQ